MENYTMVIFAAALAAWESRKTLSTDLKPVVSAYQHALFSKSPRRFYHVGRDVHLAAMLTCLPRSLQDLILPFVFYYPQSTAESAEN